MRLPFPPGRNHLQCRCRSLRLLDALCATGAACAVECADCRSSLLFARSIVISEMYML